MAGVNIYFYDLCAVKLEAEIQEILGITKEHTFIHSKDMKLTNNNT